MGCPMVILACNTASAKALRSIQQRDLPEMKGNKRVLGVIRPTTELIGGFSKTGKVGILATRGTVLSDSYPIEIKKFFPDVQVFQQASPMWVPLIENNEHNNPGADYFVKKDIAQLLAQEKDIDTVLLACTHYPLMRNKIMQFLPSSIQLIAQGEIVASSLADYLRRHPEMDDRCSKDGQQTFFTTDSTEDFDRQAGIFYGQFLQSKSIHL